MSPELRHYLVTEHLIGSAVFNFLLNGLIAWLAFGHLETVPLWGQQSVAGDTVGTTFVLPLLTCLIVTRIVRWHLRQGRAGTAALPRNSFGFLRKLPEGIGRRSLVLAAVVTLAVAPFAVGALAVSGIDGMALTPFLIFKATYAALLAAWVQPVVALRALMEAPDLAAEALALTEH